VSTGWRPTLHHVNLKTTRLAEMIEWYVTVVGMDVVHVFERGAWLTNDGASHRVAFLTTPALSDDDDKLRHTGIHHMAFECPSVDDLLATYVRLRDAGTTPHFAVDHGMSTSLYYVDPDGNSVELQVDNFDDWERSSEFMRSAPEFAADPIGTPIDPEAYLAAYEDGASFDELHRRAYGGEFRPSEPIDLRLPQSP
jgi:catechol 2,3-dioxygenase